ncbi:MAG: arsenic transporter [Firmicutes bacterium]|nr:arsenic transporter [Bacillota bacterium]
MNTTTIICLAIFAVTYICIFSFEKVRPLIACGSALLFVMLGSTGILPGFSYTFSDAAGEIDWNVLMMITGIMGTVTLFIESEMPKRIGEVIMSKVSSFRWMIVIMSIFAGVISAFVDNVATVLMIAPVALAICKKLDISPVPVIICVSISSNLQGAATLVGDTTSILLAKASGLDFMDFFFINGTPGMFFVTEIGAALSALLIFIMFRKQKQAVKIEGRTEIEDKGPAWILVLTVVALIATSFIPYKDTAQPGQFYKPDFTNGLICLAFFIIGLIREGIRTKQLSEVTEHITGLDYYTLFLLAGLFVIIGAIKKAGIIDLLAKAIFELCGGSSLSKGSMLLAYTIIVWMSVLASAFIDNIPYVATMLPVVASLTGNFMVSSAYPFSRYVLYFGLLVGATLGGNITPVGASANITGIGILRKEGYEVENKTFMKYSVPFTLIAVLTGYVLVWLWYMPGFFR